DDSLTRSPCRLPAAPQRSTLSLHDALPISRGEARLDPQVFHEDGDRGGIVPRRHGRERPHPDAAVAARVVAVQPREHLGEELARSEEHTSELQSRFDLVCRLLLEKKKGTQR